MQRDLINKVKSKCMYKIYEMSYFVVNEEKKSEFERVLSSLMIPIKRLDEVSNTYVVHVTHKLNTYIRRECRFHEVTILSRTLGGVNNEEYREYKEEQKRIQGSGE